MKTFFSFFFLIVFMTTVANAATITVNNNAGQSADYTSAQAAHDAAQPYDTLLIHGGEYGSLSITKPIVVQGKGYFLNENPKTHIDYTATTFSAGITIGSNNVVLKGLSLYNEYGNILSSGGINFTGVVVESCILSGYAHLSDFNGISVNRCMIGAFYPSTFLLSSIASYTNCIMGNSHLNSSNSSYKNCSLIGCTIYGTTGSGPTNIWFEDCILSQCGVYVTNPNATLGIVYQHCLSDNGLLPAGSGNQNVANMSTVWVGSGSSTDGNYKLLVSSPAVGAGSAGQDLGAFGGNTPYILSGLSLPHIYFLTTSTQGTAATGLDVVVKAKAGN